MHFFLSTLLTTFTLVLTVANQASALGINCRGSSNCFMGINAMGDIADAMDKAIADGHGGDWFGTGAKQACSRTIGAGFVCSFWHFGSASGTMQDARNNVSALQNHNCVNCGSVPLGSGKPDVSTGALTVNFVTSICCKLGAIASSCYCTGGARPGKIEGRGFEA